MIIIKEGDPEKARASRIYVFACSVCGCEFEADEDDECIKERSALLGYIAAACPCCGEKCCGRSKLLCNKPVVQVEGCGARKGWLIFGRIRRRKHE